MFIVCFTTLFVYVDLLILTLIFIARFHTCGRRHAKNMYTMLVEIVLITKSCNQKNVILRDCTTQHICWGLIFEVSAALLVNLECSPTSSSLLES